MLKEPRKYRVLQTLGRGGFGVVYRAEALSQGDFKKQVALKVLRADVEDAHLQTQRLRDEARILGLLNHRAVVKVDGLVELSDGWAVVMEYVHGVNASVLVQTGCSVRTALEIVDEVAGALHAAYDVPNEVTGEPLRLVHRDIKPANIRITALGAVKVLDFGVARADFQERESETVSMRFGSLRYMSPERFDGVDGPAADVFSLCLVLAELLAGKKFDEPPKNPERFDSWLDRLCTDSVAALADNERAPLEKLLREGLAYADTDRPSARKLQTRCRTLAGSMGGRSLRDFAEQEIPRLLVMWEKQAEAQAAEDPRTNSILAEMGVESVAEVTGISRSRAAVGFAAAGTAMMGAFVGLLGAVLLAGLVALLRTGDPPEPVEPVEPAVETPALPTPPEPEPAPEPEPEPEPEPPPVDEMPEEIPKPKPRPRPRASSKATVTLTGDLPSVVLAGQGSHTLRPGANKVPKGTYSVKADFDGTASIAGTLTVKGGEKAVLHCSAMLYTCSKQ